MCEAAYFKMDNADRRQTDTRGLQSKHARFMEEF